MSTIHKMSFVEFQQLLNKRLFDGSRVKLLQTIALNPDRFVGLFRPTKPMTKLIQNLTQSHEIRFGDALEEIFTKYFERLGFNNLSKKLTTLSGSVLSVDQLFESQGKIYLIEQKIRDDHDSTKKRGQFQNFESKYFEATRLYPNNQVIPIMWFIDCSLVKNKRYYLSEMAKMKTSYDCSPILCYGNELFDNIVTGLGPAIWLEIIEHLSRWKELLPDMPEINFDLLSDEVFNEIKNMQPSIYRALLENVDIRNQILPILFPHGDSLTKVRNYFDTINSPIARHISRSLSEFLSIYN